MANAKGGAINPNGGSQYHHYIPRFILRSFAHPFKPPAGKAKGRRKGPRFNEPMLYMIDLADQGDIVEAPVAKSFGVQDMYRDFHGAGSQHDLEQRLSQLESKAGAIIARVRKVHEAGDSHVNMTRAERNCLRKFLFIMKYRSSSFYKRYNHQRAEDYCSNDREMMLEYMERRGFVRPIDVWFDNIRSILDLKMEADLSWAAQLSEKIYPADAHWAIAHIQMMYLAICTPADPSDEFLLSENLFSIHEGPVSVSINPDTGEEEMRAYTEYHIFAAIAPRLMIVLRSTLLPNSEEDQIPNAKEERQKLYDMSRAAHTNPHTAHSTLEDLPVQKANNSYTEIINGRRHARPGEDGTPRANHIFQFRFFPIESNHVNKINRIILEETYRIGNICFHSKPAALRTLEWYLSASGSLPNEPFKRFNGQTDPRLAALKKLSYAASLLGSKVQATYTTRDLKKEQQDLFDELDNGLRGAIQDSEFAAGYLALGGSGKSMMYDMDQASKMVYLRIKIDVCTRDLEEVERQRIRDSLVNLFQKLPSRRFYLYLKRWRIILISEYLKNKGVPEAEDMMDGPEDIIAKASSVFLYGHINRIMYCATLHDIEKIKSYRSDADIGAMQTELLLYLLKRDILFTFDLPGIAIVEEKARVLKRSFEENPQHVPDFHGLLTHEQSVDIATRICIREDWDSLMAGKLSAAGLNALKVALFDTVFKTQLG